MKPYSNHSFTIIVNMFPSYLFAFHFFKSVQEEKVNKLQDNSAKRYGNHKTLLKRSVKYF